MTLGREKISFLNTPTPLHKLENLSDELGINLYIKRDDLTNFGTGGNKLRKLEYFLKDAKDKGCTFLLTVGGAQTNHGRLTAAVAAKYGMKAAIIAVDPYPGELSANLLLDAMMGCNVYLVQDDNVHSEDELLDMEIKKVTADLEAQGEKVYFIPMGGSNELGILGYYDCAVEIARQAEEIGIDNARVVSTVGSLGTYMGLAVGIANENLPLKLTGINIYPKEGGSAKHAKEYFDRIKNFYGLDLDMKKEDFHIEDQYDFGAYNNPVEEVRQAMYYMARKEAIILDPCYTGKTFNGLLAMVKSGEISPGENVILIHTGGIPGIYTKHHRIEMEKELSDYIHIV